MMKQLTVFMCFAGLMLGVSGCSSYYYSVLSSADKVDQRNSTRDFVQENDSVSVQYCFYGENAPIRITIHNKLDEPISVDWARSGLIVDDVVTTYDSAPLSIKGGVSVSSSGSGYQWKNGVSTSSGSSSGRFSGEVEAPKGISYIPPQSRIENMLMNLTDFSFVDIPNKEYHKIVLTKSDVTEVEARAITFTEQDSPLHFRSFLTLYTENEGASRKKIYLERSFYLSRLIKAGNVSPSKFEESKRENGDFFYVNKPRGVIAGSILLGVAVVGGVCALAITAPDQPVH